MLIYEIKNASSQFQVVFPFFFGSASVRAIKPFSLHLRQICFEFVTGEMKCDLKTNCCHSTLVLQPK